MAVDVIARALAAKASQGGSGGGNKVPIDISYAMEEVYPVIRDSYSPINQMVVLLPEDLAEYIGSKIAAAGKDNVSLFFKQFKQDHH